MFLRSTIARLTRVWLHNQVGKGIKETPLSEHLIRLISLHTSPPLAGSTEENNVLAEDWL
jgi:hypothetical protein